MTSNGPCLVEVGTRCHGGEATWAPVAQECIGYTQIEATLNCYLRPDRFEALPSSPQTLLKQGAEVFLVSHQSGLSFPPPLPLCPPPHTSLQVLSKTPRDSMRSGTWSPSVPSSCSLRLARRYRQPSIASPALVPFKWSMRRSCSWKLTAKESVRWNSRKSSFLSKDHTKIRSYPPHLLR
jgi:hypothetical protein